MFSTRKLIVPTIAVTIAACASTPPSNPRLTQIESELHSAYGDKYVAEYGQADLARAETSLSTARTSIRKGHDDETQHDLTMAEGYIALGAIHGRQEQTKAETVALKVRQEQIRLTARDRDVQQANDRTSAAQAETAAANSAAEDANNRADVSRADAAAAQAATENAQEKLTAMRSQLSMYDIKINELGATLVLRDVTFDTNSTVIRAGAINRLDPLIAYLRTSPATTVRIEGHTDSTGSAEHNNELSLGRANSVKLALLASGTVTNTIATYGAGQSKPVATNATVSGREQNRRVEVTLQ